MLTGSGCPECGSEETYETTVSVNDTDDVDACMCDDCGHVEVKFARPA
jgi:Zn ribbon nucleic-acid-binding protein